MSLVVEAIKTDLFLKNQDLLSFVVCSVDAHLENKLLKERSIIVVTSKIMSLAEGRLVEKNSIEKNKLIHSQAEQVLGTLLHGTVLTRTCGMLVPTAGIDESNSSEQEYILYPENPQQSAQQLWQGLRSYYQVKELGVIVTDSHSRPVRRGVIGEALAHYGFRGVKSRVGDADLFGRPLKMTQVGVADAMAGVAVLLMGEAAEQTPLALISAKVGAIEFGDFADPLYYAPSEDMYEPLLGALSKL